jgi:putative nucleotidyltransferase with HDIG domain
VERLSALRAIDAAITSGLDLRLVLETFVLHVVTKSGVDAADVLRFHPQLGELEFFAGRGFRADRIPRWRIPVDGCIAGQAVRDRRMIQIPDLGAAAISAAASDFRSREGFVGYLAFPLIAKGEVKGVLELFQRSSLEPAPDWLDFIHTLAGQSAIALADAELFERLQRSNRELLSTYDETIEAWARVMDLRDKETVGHTQRVTSLALRLASRMGVEESELVQIRRGALLHDIGKMAIPDHILFKPEPLTDEEWDLMREHPRHALEMLAPITFLRPAIDIPYCHHERWDGTGYPRGLKGEEIPLAARIFAVVDVYDALASDRPYRKAVSAASALEYIRAQSGRHFDPQVVDRFLKMLDEQK